MLSRSKIEDKKWGKDILGYILDCDKKFKEEIKKYPAIKLVGESELNYLDWQDGTHQYRIKYWIEKEKDKNVTWNTIYGIVNRINVSVFDFV